VKGVKILRVIGNAQRTGIYAGVILAVRLLIEKFLKP
jgi:hypothetical protein